MASVLVSGSPAFVSVASAPARVGRVALDVSPKVVSIVGLSATSKAVLGLVGGPAFPAVADVPVAVCTADTLTITSGATAVNCVVDYVVFG